MIKNKQGMAFFLDNKKFFLRALMIILLATIFSVIVLAVGETTPCAFAGTATLNGVGIVAGDVVEAYDPDGVLCGTFTHPGGAIPNGQYGPLMCKGDNPDTTGVDEGAEEGDQITFFINGVQATLANSSTTDDIWTEGGVKWYTDLEAFEAECTEDADCAYLTDECNTGKCDLGTYTCYPEPVADDTPCGDSSDTECDNPDSCLSGVCEPNYEASGFACGDQGVECLVDDTCDDAGTCTDNGFEPTGTYCGSARDCPDDACNGFFAEFYPDDGHDTCDDSGNCIQYSCAMEDTYCTDDDAIDGVNGLTCGAECDQDSDCSMGEECVNCVCTPIGECVNDDDCNYLDDECADGVCNMGTFTCEQQNKPDTTMCRASAGICDLEEYCTGTDPSCPADAFEPASTECRASSGDCDLVEYCTGSSVDCPADLKSTDECRAAVDECDAAEFCDGVSNDCPVDAKQPAGTYCGFARDCPADVCNGFFAEFYPDDGHDTCDGAGTCNVYSCEMEDTYCTDNDPGDGVNSLECGAPCDQDSDCGVGEVCNLASCTCVESQCLGQPDGTPCENGLVCDGADECQSEVCVNVGPAVDCSANDITGIATCDNDPDANPYTWDSRNSFTSTCQEPSGTCTTGDSTVTHACDVAQCSAECDAQNPCIDIGDTCNLDTCLCEYEPIPYCGDGNLDPDEECDDGNNIDGDGCSADCMLELEGECTPHTIGYWKQPCKGHFNHETQESMEEYLETVHDLTDFFDDVEDFDDMCEILEPKEPASMQERAQQQIMALWLNVASGKLYLQTTIDLGNLSDSGTVGDALDEAESLIDSDPEKAKDIADKINNAANTGDVIIECLPTLPECGNGILEGEEECDEGEDNGIECIPPYAGSCEYCSETCEIIELIDGYCGDGVLDEPYEECDDGNNEDGDGCSANCELEGLCEEDEELVEFTYESKPTSAFIDECGDDVSDQLCNDGYLSVNTGDENTHYVYLNWDGDELNVSDYEDAEYFDLMLYHKEASTLIKVQLKDEFGTWIDVCDPAESSSFTWDTCDLMPYLDTLGEVDDIELRVVAWKAGTCHEYLGCAKLKVKLYRCEPLYICGDGNVDPGEECDEGENNGVECDPPYGGSCEYCSETCEIVKLYDGFCGDELVQDPYEECEYPGTDDNSYCGQTTQECSGKKLGTRDAYGDCDAECGCVDDPFNYQCVKDECGAECDSDDDCNDCNPNTIDTCNLNTCMCEHEEEPYCGDGNLDPDEECDDGVNNGVECIPPYGGSCEYCSETCEIIELRDGYCGDGVLDEPYEECDDGVNNGVECVPPYDGSCQYCSENCEIIELYDGFCGDDVVQDPYEECDGGFRECFDQFGYAGYELCKDDCTWDECETYEWCGDGIINDGETCELPGTDNNSYCSQSIIDDCDGTKLGVRDAYGYCSNVCGCLEDPFKYICVKDECGAECDSDDDCSDCNPNTIDTCNQETCVCEFIKIPACGDGILDDGEECDEGVNNGIECIPSYEESCTYCSDTCENVTLIDGYCGDGVLDEPYEECDDGNNIGGDGCNADCTKGPICEDIFLWLDYAHTDLWCGGNQDDVTFEANYSDNIYVQQGSCSDSIPNYIYMYWYGIDKFDVKNATVFLEHAEFFVQVWLEYFDGSEWVQVCDLPERVGDALDSCNVDLVEGLEDFAIRLAILRTQCHENLDWAYLTLTKCYWPDSEPECLWDSDCDEGYVCVDGFCEEESDPEPECVSDVDCSEGEVCVDGFCVEEPEPECVVDDDCDEGYVCVDGLCVLNELEPECVSDIDCDQGEVCVDGVCVEEEPECVEDSDCDEGYVCTDGECQEESGGEENGDNGGGSSKGGTSSDAWYCGAWSECTEGTQIQLCTQRAVTQVLTKSCKLEERPSVESEQEAEEEDSFSGDSGVSEEETEEQETETNVLAGFDDTDVGPTGAVVGARSVPPWAFPLFLLGLLAALLIYVVLKMRSQK